MLYTFQTREEAKVLLRQIQELRQGGQPSKRSEDAMDDTYGSITHNDSFQTQNNTPSNFLPVMNLRFKFNTPD